MAAAAAVRAAAATGRDRRRTAVVAAVEEAAEDRLTRPRCRRGKTLPRLATCRRRLATERRSS